MKKILLSLVVLATAGFRRLTLRLSIAQPILLISQHGLPLTKTVTETTGLQLLLTILQLLLQDSTEQMATFQILGQQTL